LACGTEAKHAGHDSGLHGYPRGVNQAPDFFGAEQLQSLFRAMKAKGLLFRPLKARPEPDRNGDQPFVKGVFENRPDMLDGRGQPMRSPLLGQLVPQRGEVLRVEIGYQPGLAHVRDQLNRGALIVRPVCGDSSPEASSASLAFKNAFAASLAVRASGSVRGFLPACKASFCSRYFVRAPSGSAHGPK
jgi:hypothetical protein